VFEPEASHAALQHFGSGVPQLDTPCLDAASMDAHTLQLGTPGGCGGRAIAAQLRVVPRALPPICQRAVCEVDVRRYRGIALQTHVQGSRGEH
jgi:hypothetical protein